MLIKKPTGLLHLKGIIKINIVAAETRAEVITLFQPFLNNIKNAIRGAKATLCGLDRTPMAKTITDNSSLELMISISDSTRKNV